MIRTEAWSDPSLLPAQIGFSLAEFAAVSLLLVDENLRVHYANADARQLFDSEPESMATDLLEILPGLGKVDAIGWGAPTGFGLLDELTRMGTQLEARHPRGSFKVEIDARPVVIDGIEGRVVVVRDMSEQNASLATILRAHRELEDFNRIAVGRELRMIDLKQEVNDLLGELDLPPRYEIKD